MLLFSGADDGIIRKYERLQLNSFMYSQEELIIPKDLGLKHKQLIEPAQTVKKNGKPMNAEEKRRNHAARHKEVGEKLESWKRTTISIENMVHGKQIELVSKNAEREFKKAMSKHTSKAHRSLSNLEKTERDEKGNKVRSTEDFKAKIKPSILALYYYEVFVQSNCPGAGYPDCWQRGLQDLRFRV